MASGDDVSFPVVYGLPDNRNVPSLQSLNENIRRIWNKLHELEGRVGPSTVRDDLAVLGDLTVSGDISPEEVAVAAEGTLVAQRGRVNFIQDGAVTITVEDDEDNDQVNVTISA